MSEQKHHPKTGQQGQPNRGGDNGAPSDVHAPFNFVPLAKKILLPEWSKKTSQDMPFEDGVSGWLEIEITAKTPLLVGGESTQQPGRPKEVHFFRLPDDGLHAIPGASLRGMVRSVLEIATFSRMRLVDDRRFSVRDLNNQEVYGKKLTESKNGAYKSRSRAGWLRFEEGRWCLYPCAYSRIEQELIDGYAKTRIGDAKRSAEEKYKKLLERKVSLSVRFDTDPKTDWKHSRVTLIYSKVKSLGGGKPGYLVMTGQPRERTYKEGEKGVKHMEFVFSPPTTNKIRLDDRAISDFKFIYFSAGEWEYLNKANLFPDCGIPVFYLQDEKGKIGAMGLAQMFKLAYKHSVHDMIRHRVEEELYDSLELDFAETLFGRVAEKPEDALKGRLSFDYAVCTDQNPRTAPQERMILSAPKPSYYPIYVSQEGRKNNPYKTYMDDDATISGWKRYPVREKPQLEPLQAQQAGNLNIQVRLNPLREGTRFTGKMRFHNVKPEELGALAWALTWGGNEKYFHALGMGKPFGFGRIQIQIKSANIIPNDIRQQPHSNWSSYMGKFVSFMNNRIENWAKTPQLIQLHAMADPGKAKTKNLSYMKLGNGSGQNQFANAKKSTKILEHYEKA